MPAPRHPSCSSYFEGWTLEEHATFRPVLFLALSPALVHADYKESYKKGLEAVESKKWTEAARLMQEAIAEKPKEGESIRLYGQRFETYLPHYYLGLSFYGAGNCELAVKAFQESESQGRHREVGQEYKTLTKDRDACEVQLAKAGPKPPATTPTPAATTKPSGPDAAAVAQATRDAEAEIKRAEELSTGTLRPCRTTLCSPTSGLRIPRSGLLSSALATPSLRPTLAWARAAPSRTSRRYSRLGTLGKQAADQAERSEERRGAQEE